MNWFNHETILKIVLDRIDSWIDSRREYAILNQFMNWIEDEQIHEVIEKIDFESIHRIRIDSWIDLSLLFHIKFERGNCLRFLKNYKLIHVSIHVAINKFLNQFKYMVKLVTRGINSRIVLRRCESIQAILIFKN